MSEALTEQALQYALKKNFFPGAFGAPSASDSVAPPVPLENRGMTVADVIGWRCWKLHGAHLCSWAAGAIWIPGEVMEGNPDRESEGIHAFDSLAEALKMVAGGTVSVVGRVQVWGRVVRHERGLRAEYARIVGIDDIVGGPPMWSADYDRALARLRAMYLTEDRNG